MAAKSLKQTRNSISDSSASVIRGNQILTLFCCPSLFKRGGKGKVSIGIPGNLFGLPGYSSVNSIIFAG
jgi:hypothetical protein